MLFLVFFHFRLFHKWFSHCFPLSCLSPDELFSEAEIFWKSRALFYIKTFWFEEAEKVVEIAIDILRSYLPYARGTKNPLWVCSHINGCLWMISCSIDSNCVCDCVCVSSRGFISFVLLSPFLLPLFWTSAVPCAISWWIYFYWWQIIYTQSLSSFLSSLPFLPHPSLPKHHWHSNRYFMSRNGNSSTF